MVRRKHRQRDELGYLDIAFYALLAFAGVWYFYPQFSGLFMDTAERDRIEASVHYAGCDEVRLLGKAPLYRGQPGYRSEMDGDGDGIACEPHRY